MREQTEMLKRGGCHDPVQVMTEVNGQIARAVAEGFFLSSIGILWDDVEHTFRYHLTFILDEGEDDTV